MSIENFRDLKAAIADEINRTDLSEVIPNWVRIMESRFGREIQHRKMQTVERLNLRPGIEAVEIPSGYLSTQALVLEDEPRNPLMVRSIQDLISEYPLATVGQPEAYAVFAEHFYFRPVSDKARTATLFFYKALDRLTADSDSNWLLADHPDIYLYGSLISAAPYLGDDERLTVWSSLYESATRGLKDDDARGRYSGAPVRPHVQGAVV